MSAENSQANTQAGSRVPGTYDYPAPQIFEAIIIGSGFGGAVTACRLSQAFEQRRRGGRKTWGAEKICLLERGRRYEGQDFPRVKLPEYLTDDPDLKTSRRVPDVSRLLWGIDLGLIDYRNLGQLQVVQGAGFGGGSLVYANVHLRPPAQVLEKWPEGYQREDLDRFYDLVAEWLEVSPLPADEMERIPKAQLMRKVATALGRAGEHALLRPPLAVRWKQQGSGENRYGKAQRPCNGCGNCIIGCQEGAKNTLDLNYLAVAEAEGEGAGEEREGSVERRARTGGGDGHPAGRARPAQLEVGRAVADHRPAVGGQRDPVALGRVEHAALDTVGGAGEPEGQGHHQEPDRWAPDHRPSDVPADGVARSAWREASSANTRRSGMPRAVRSSIE